jgi:hypothetical protein
VIVLHRLTDAPCDDAVGGNNDDDDAANGVSHDMQAGNSIVNGRIVASRRVAALRNIVRSARLTRAPDLVASTSHGIERLAPRGLVARSVERLTRYLPLCNEHTLLLNNVRSAPLRELVDPIVKAITGTAISDDDLLLCSRLLGRLRE